MALTCHHNLFTCPPQAAAQPPVHATKPGVTAVEVLPLLPDVEAMGHRYAVLNFDEDPAREVDAFSKLPEAQRRAAVARRVRRAVWGVLLSSCTTAVDLAAIVDPAKGVTCCSKSQRRATMARRARLASWIGFFFVCAKRERDVWRPGLPPKYLRLQSCHRCALIITGAIPKSAWFVSYLFLALRHRRCVAKSFKFTDPDGGPDAPTEQILALLVPSALAAAAPSVPTAALAEGDYYWAKEYKYSKEDADSNVLLLRFGQQGVTYAPFEVRSRRLFSGRLGGGGSDVAGCAAALTLVCVL